jgi:hypothetical protein
MGDTLNTSTGCCWVMVVWENPFFSSFTFEYCYCLHLVVHTKTKYQKFK